MANTTAATGMSVKAFLLTADGESTNDVRRFGVPEAVSTNFEYLQQRVKIVFSLNANKDIKIFWEDDDLDRIIISSDDELLEAIAECICRQQRHVLKLYIVPKQSNDEPKNNVHIGVVCDGCNQKLSGMRFKCKTCFDFDLCNDCKLKGLHPQHQLENLGLPKGRYFAGQGGSSSKNEKVESDKEKCGMGGHWGRQCPGRRGGRGGRNRWGGGRAHRSFNEMDEGAGWPFSFVPPMVDLSECFEQFFPEETRNRMGAANSQTAGHAAEFMKNIWEAWSGAFENRNGTGTAQNEQPTTSSGTKPKTTKTPEKENVINIDIEMDNAGFVKHCSVKRQNDVKKSSESTQVAANSNPVINIEIPQEVHVVTSPPQEVVMSTPQEVVVIPPQEVVMSTPQEVVMSTPQKVVMSTPQEVMSTPQKVVIENLLEEVVIESSIDVLMETDNPPSEGEDWTLLNQDSSSSRPVITQEDDVISIDDEIQVITPREVTQSTTSVQVYPKLPIDTPSIASASSSAPASRKDIVVTTEPQHIPVIPQENSLPCSEEQRIANSLRYMEAMGYSNEGGWLTRLLQLKKGDINLVLDILMGPRKK